MELREVALEPCGEDTLLPWHGQMDFEYLVGEYIGSLTKLRTTVLVSSFTLLYKNGRPDTNSMCSFCYPKLTETKEMKDLLQ